MNNLCSNNIYDEFEKQDELLFKICEELVAKGLPITAETLAASQDEYDLRLCQDWLEDHE
jgi:hypothetical protein